ncbi:MAG TPA: hypothetical protein VEV37_09420 [Bryobacteraceae bacterium]|nr:hypothetical protein [Bryobacteraceae bacterium]
MATKKSPKSKRVSGESTKKVAPAKRATKAKRTTKAKRATKKKLSKRTAKMKPAGRSAAKKIKRAKAPTRRKPVRRGAAREASLDRRALESSAGVMSGDTQGLRGVEQADSESVSELLEEGNAFEAGIVSGVEEAEDDPEKELRPREVKEDDVPPEYLDED